MFAIFQIFANFLPKQWWSPLCICQSCFAEKGVFVFWILSSSSSSRVWQRKGRVISSFFDRLLLVDSHDNRLLRLFSSTFVGVLIGVKETGNEFRQSWAAATPTSLFVSSQDSSGNKRRMKCQSILITELQTPQTLRDWFSKRLATLVFATLWEMRKNFSIFIFCGLPTAAA